MRSSCPYPIPRFRRQSHNRVQGVLVTTPTNVPTSIAQNKANILTRPFDTKCFDASVSARPYNNNIIQPSTGVETVWTAVAIKAAAAKLLKKNPHLPPGTVAAHKHIESLPVWNLSLLYI
ncbi:hypothetical protein TWF706_003328 [Orbilia oligospora]|nr:hypothetical protein TWF706_003328 [Orbilia oligospora]